jgi:hypothetical protein
MKIDVRQGSIHCNSVRVLTHTKSCILLYADFNVKRGAIYTGAMISENPGAEFVFYFDNDDLSKILAAKETAICIIANNFVGAKTIVETNKHGAYIALVKESKSKRKLPSW